MYRCGLWLNGALFADGVMTWLLEGELGGRWLLLLVALAGPLFLGTWRFGWHERVWAMVSRPSRKESDADSCRCESLPSDKPSKPVAICVKTQ